MSEIALKGSVRSAERDVHVVQDEEEGDVPAL